MAAAHPEGPEVTSRQWSLDTTPEGLVLRLSDSWRMQDGLPSPAEVEAQLGAQPSARRLAFDTREVTGWDTGLLVFVHKVLGAATARGLTVDVSGLPEGVRKLLGLAAVVPERDTKRGGEDQSRLARIGNATIAAALGAREMITFVGEASLALARAAVGRARFRRVDLLLNIQQAG